MIVSLNWHQIFFSPTVEQIKYKSSNNSSFSKTDLILYSHQIKNRDRESYITLKRENEKTSGFTVGNCALVWLLLRVMYTLMTIPLEHSQFNENTLAENGNLWITGCLWPPVPAKHLKSTKFSLFMEIVVMDHNRKRCMSHAFWPESQPN